MESAHVDLVLFPKEFVSPAVKVDTLPSTANVFLATPTVLNAQEPSILAPSA
jgi:hypothetical protein